VLTKIYLQIGLALLLILGVAPLAADTVEPVRVAVTDFGGPFDTMRSAITEIFIADLSLSPAMQLVEKTRIDEVKEQLKMALTDVFDESTAPEMGRLVSAQKVVVGQFSMMEGVVHLSARLVDVETGLVEVGQGAVVEGDIAGNRADIYALVHQLANRFHRRLTGDWLPAAVLDEIGASSTLSVLEKIDPMLALQQAGGEIGVELSIDKGARSTYAMGETMVLTVAVDRPCHVYVYNIDVRQNVCLVFPNAFERNNELQPGLACTVPAPNARWELCIEDVPGEERMIAIASETPLEHTAAGEGNLSEYADSYYDFIAKAVKPRLKSSADNVWGVATVSFFTTSDTEGVQ